MSDHRITNRSRELQRGQHLHGAAFGLSTARRSPRGPRKDRDFYESRESTRSYIRRELCKKENIDTDLFLTELPD